MAARKQLKKTEFRKLTEAEWTQLENVWKRNRELGAARRKAKRDMELTERDLQIIYVRKRIKEMDPRYNGVVGSRRLGKVLGISRQNALQAIDTLKRKGVYLH